MKKLLLIAGIVILAAAVLSLLYALLNLLGYRGVLDGSASLYERLHQRMIAFGAAGLVLALLGALCLIVRARM